MADIVVFVPPGSRVRYSPSQYIEDDGGVVVMPAAALENPEASKVRIPEGIRLALVDEPLIDAQPLVDVNALIDRLQHAERVCALYGWSPAPDIDEHDRVAATAEVWIEWLQHVRATTGDREFPMPSNYPELTDEAIAALAQKRRAVRAETLRRIEAEMEADRPHPEEVAEEAFLDEADRDEHGDLDR